MTDDRLSRARVLAALEAKKKANDWDDGNSHDPDFFWGCDEGIEAAIAIVAALPLPEPPRLNFPVGEEIMVALDDMLDPLIPANAEFHKVVLEILALAPVSPLPLTKVRVTNVVERCVGVSLSPASKAGLIRALLKEGE